MDPTKWADWIKLAPRYLVGLCLASGALLYGPKAWLNSLGMDGFVSEFRIWIGLVFLVGSSMLLAQGGAGVIPAVRNWVIERRRLKSARQRLHDLTGEEKAILGDYIARKSRTQVLRVTNGVVAGLSTAHALASTPATKP